MGYLIDGFLIGLAYVAPIGVQNLFMINTALTQSRSRSYLVAFIIMFFDITLAVACFFGIGLIMSASKWLELIVLGIGSLIVLWIGFSIIRSKDELDTGTNVDIPIKKVIVTACVVTWFNPHALIDGSMLLGAFKASIPEGYNYIFIAGVCAASAFWWLFIATVVGLFKSKINSKVLRVINIVCGGIILFYGGKLLMEFIKILQAML